MNSLKGRLTSTFLLWGSNALLLANEARLEEHAFFSIAGVHTRLAYTRDNDQGKMITKVKMLFSRS
jgi:hypothetical protein